MSNSLNALALICGLKPSPVPSSSQLMAQRVLERLDAELSETDDAGRALTFGKVALTAVVGNEDGAHKITTDLFPGPQRRRLQHPGPGRRVLERRGRERCRLQRPG